jgi:branched-chain amino acid transport system substrate-binding protein
MGTSKRRTAGWLVLLCAVLGLALAACGGGGSSSSSETAAGETAAANEGSTAQASGESCTAGGPIKIGAVVGRTGAIPVPHAVEGAQAFFEELNEEGGVCGQEVEYIQVDDKGEPQASATAARQLVLQENVDAMINESFVDCAVNKSFYEQEGIRVTGAGVNPACYNSVVFGMTNNGPTGSLLGSLIYAASPEGLHQKTICAELLQLPGYSGQFQEAREIWEQETGLKLALYDNTVQPTSDPTSYIIKAKEAGCESVALVGNVELMVPWMKAVETQNAGNIDWLWPGTDYIEAVPKALGKSGNEIVYSDPELEPELTNPAVKHAYERINMIPGGPTDGVNGIHLAGWLAAEIMTEALKSIEGEVTREALSEALENIKGFKSPFMGGPFEWREIPNHWIKVARIKGEKWEVVTPKWLDITQLAKLE